MKPGVTANLQKYFLVALGKILLKNVAETERLRLAFMGDQYLLHFKFH